eukprot:CAMPEP_0119465008 /NCGR_PEP_ID=MMETSP1344-20130328/340_1 /TAXON_ID=236787 /ORGANISM="Florenciella parvula, Strain CCMP2471" /LENGTH=559 /DNA_ID=CAMNT_0007497249 /DNA_START=110 /DNA_END=1789 /DNA_ORIENTATION=-
MGKKKGKQKGRHGSKLASYAAELNRFADAAVDQDAKQKGFKVSLTAAAAADDDRREAVLQQAFTLRSLLTAGEQWPRSAVTAPAPVRAPNASANAKAAANSAAALTWSAATTPIPPLSELCAVAVGKSLTMYDGVEFADIFSYMEPHLVSQIAEVASNAQQLTPQTLPLVCTPDVKQLVLYATSLRGDPRDPRDPRKSCDSCEEEGEQGGSAESRGTSRFGLGAILPTREGPRPSGRELDAAVDGEGEVDEDDGTEPETWLDRPEASLDLDLDLDLDLGGAAHFFESHLAVAPGLKLRGCHSLTSLTLWTPPDGGLSKDALLSLATSVPTLTRLSLPASFPIGDHYGASDGPGAILSAVPQMERLEFLGLRHCSWFEDFVLSDLVKLLIQRDQKAAACASGGGSGRGSGGGSGRGSGHAAHHAAGDTDGDAMRPEVAWDEADRRWMDEGASDGEEEVEDGGVMGYYGDREHAMVRLHRERQPDRDTAADEEWGLEAGPRGGEGGPLAHPRAGACACTGPYLRLVQGVDCAGSRVSAAGAADTAMLVKRLGAGVLLVRLS